jgi:hypothetical protein
MKLFLTYMTTWFHSQIRLINFIMEYDTLLGLLNDIKGENFVNFQFL